MALTPAGYPVDKYFKFIPKNVLASNVHQTAYLNKRKVAHQALTMDMIADLYITFKCNHEVIHQDEYDEHTELVHGIIPSKLRALNTIEIDTKQVFIEHVSLDEQDKILSGWFTRSVGRGVIKKNTNKANSDLNESRRTEFPKRGERFNH